MNVFLRKTFIIRVLAGEKDFPLNASDWASSETHGRKNETDWQYLL